MKLAIVLCLVAVAAAAPQRGGNYLSSTYNDVQLLRYDNYPNAGDGAYRYSYDQSDGQIREEQGETRNAGSDDEYLVVKGSYTWVGPDGVTYTIHYVADENGYQPEVEQGPGGAIPDAVAATLIG